MLHTALAYATNRFNCVLLPEERGKLQALADDAGLKESEIVVTSLSFNSPPSPQVTATLGAIPKLTPRNRLARPKGFEPLTGGLETQSQVAQSDGGDVDSRGYGARSDTKAHGGPPPKAQTGRTPDADPVEVALAEAVALAARAGQWTTVELLSRELAARRLAASSPEVPTLEAERARRERK